MSEIKQKVKAYIIEEFCDDDNASSITDQTPLLSSGIIDSISALQLVEFIEENYGFQFQANEVDQDNLNTLDQIEAFIKTKV